MVGRPQLYGNREDLDHRRLHVLDGDLEGTACRVAGTVHRGADSLVIAHREGIARRRFAEDLGHPAVIGGRDFELDHRRALTRVVGHGHALPRYLDLGGNRVNADLDLHIVGVGVMV